MAATTISFYPFSTYSLHWKFRIHHYGVYR